MSAHPSPIPPQDDPAQPADPHNYGETLHDLITMGTDFARLLHAQATAHPQPTHPAAALIPQDTDPLPPTPPITLAAAFDSTARAVRRAILLARSLARPLQPAPLQPATDPAQPRAAARRRILREVEDAIQRTPDPADAETLQAELRDRLDTPDLDADLTTRPVADIITELCRDLGLAALPGARPWKRRTPDDIRQLCARAAAPTTLRQPGPQAPKRNATPSPPIPNRTTMPLSPARSPAPSTQATARRSTWPEPPRSRPTSPASKADGARHPKAEQPPCRPRAETNPAQRGAPCRNEPRAETNLGPVARHRPFLTRPHHPLAPNPVRW